MAGEWGTSTDGLKSHPYKGLFMRCRWVFCALPLLLSGCTESGDAEGSIAIVFETDLRGVYGEVAISVDGAAEPVKLLKNEYSCAFPSIKVPPGELRFKALSGRNFAWKGSRVVGEKGCEAVTLDALSMISGMAGLAVHEEIDRCLPIEVWLGQPGKEDRLIGSIWLQNPPWDGEGDEEFKRHGLSDSASYGGSVVWGTGWDEEAELEFVWKKLGDRPSCKGPKEGREILSVRKGETRYLKIPGE